MTPSERDELAQRIMDRMAERFPSDGPTPSPSAIRTALTDIVAEVGPMGFTVEPDPDRPGAILLTGPVEVVAPLAELRIPKSEGET